jgi:BTB/POZ domain-containing protein KCTD9
LKSERVNVIRKSFPESCEVLKGLGFLEGDVSPKLPERAPRYDDEEWGVSFFRTSVADAALENLTLARTFFGRSEIRGVSFRGTDLSESTMNWNDLIEVDFTGASLEGADLRASIFDRVRFLDANLRGADLRRATFRNCDFTGADMTGARLSRAIKWYFRLSRAQRAVIDWQAAGPEPEGG